MTRLGQAAYLGLAVLLATIAWQALNVTVLYQGHWSGLFWAGTVKAQPPELPPVYQHHDRGFDAQFYRLIAHRPFPRAADRPYFDDQRYRYGRPLVPWLAYALGAGQDHWIDTAYVAVIDLGIAISVVLLWWLTPALPRYHALIAGMLLPSTIGAADRMMPDVYLVLFVLAALVADRFTHRRVACLWICCLLAGLTKEYGVLLAAGLCLHALMRARWLKTALLAASQLPVLVWQVYLWAATPPSKIALSSIRGIRIPVLAQVVRLFEPRHPASLASWQLFWLQATDALSLILVTAMLLGFAVVALRTRHVPRASRYVLGAFSTFLLACTFLQDPYVYIRIVAVPIAGFAVWLLPRRPWATVMVLALLSSGMWFGAAIFRLLGGLPIGSL